jgi:hypothetical protein
MRRYPDESLSALFGRKLPGDPVACLAKDANMISRDWFFFLWRFTLWTLGVQAVHTLNYQKEQ